MTEPIVDPLAHRETWYCGSVFNNSTRVIVAEYARRDGERTVDSLYFRDPVTRLYERLPAPDESTSYGSPVVGRDAPYVLFNVMCISERGGGDWVHVARADIRTHRIEVVLTPDELVLALACAPEWPLHPWVSRLISASDDARILTCKVGIPVPSGYGACSMHYWFCDFDVESRALTRIVEVRRPAGYLRTFASGRSMSPTRGSSARSPERPDA